VWLFGAADAERRPLTDRRAAGGGESVAVLSGMGLRGVHHVAIIVSDIAAAKRLYVEILGLRIVHEAYRAERRSHKVDLALPDGVQIELFTFPDAPARVSNPEARGLRHLALAVDGLDAEIARLAGAGVMAEPVRVDEFTGRRFTFIRDPDGLPIELYEAG
jgi:glyoxylase I family protein